MRLKRLKRVFSTSATPTPNFIGCLNALDKSVPILRTGLLIAGIVGAALGVDTADYLFAAGLLLHFTIWFENWWLALDAR
jgi:hypothetical protein